MQAIARICDRVVWLDKGRVVQNGEPAQVVADYQAGLIAPQPDWSAKSYTNEPRGKRQQQPVA